jgi:hypothetical protein
MKEWITTTDAEKQLGLTKRQWASLAPSLGGRKDKGRWLIPTENAKRFLGTTTDDKSTDNEKKEEDKVNQHNIAIEQYKILFNVIINLGDNVVKSVLTIFLIYTAITALVIRGIDSTPEIKNVLYINYALIAVFSYYLGYLRFRIVTMFELVERIEKEEGYRFMGIRGYESKTNYRFFSTKGLYLVIVLALLGINTLILNLL